MVSPILFSAKGWGMNKISGGEEMLAVQRQWSRSDFLGVLPFEGMFRCVAFIASSNNINSKFMNYACKRLYEKHWKWMFENAISFPLSINFMRTILFIYLQTSSNLTGPYRAYWSINTVPTFLRKQYFFTRSWLFTVLRKIKRYVTRTKLSI